MKVSDIMGLFQQMPASDRLYLLCKMIQGCLTYELNYVSIVLSGYLKERLSGVPDIQADANSVPFYSSFKDTKVLPREKLEVLSACLALIRHDNCHVGDEIYKVLDQRSILTMAEELEDLSLFESLRLVYVMAVYHPSLSFQRRHHLLTIYLYQLDEIYNSKVAERNAMEAQAMEFDQNRPKRPADSAHIVHCDLIGFYKRQSDRRYAYVIKVEWSDGAFCNVQRTYGDFFGFQNKLLDLFPDESGQKNKKSRVIPFLPGRRLLSGKSNRELAEKRLPDLFNYTRDLFQLERISSCKHVQDFFRPHLSDQRDLSMLHKFTTLADIKESGKIRHPSAPPSSSLSTGSPKTRSGFSPSILSSLSSTRNAQTLPPEKSPGSQRDKKVNKHSTLPVQSAFVPISPSTPSSSTERLQSSSQTSLGSIDRLLTTPTTTACRVVTPTVARGNGSPAFSVSHTSSPLTSSSWSNIHESPNTLVKPVRMDLSSKSDSKIEITTDHAPSQVVTTTVSSSLPPSPPPIKSTSVVTTATPNISTSSWAECSPPATTDTSFYFSAHMSPDRIPINATSTSSVFRPIQTTPTRKHQNITLSPSLTQLQHYGGGGSQPTYSTYPISYTPTNFESPNPSPSHTGMGGRWQSSYGPLCGTPTNQTPPSEADQCRKWLKAHRLHKYENLFQEMSFEEMSSLTVEQLKDKGMTLGAAKKLHQKMEELKQSNIHSFRDIPHSSLSRKPSTSSLPAALLLQERGVTPSSSIDQLSSLHGSSCSLDILGQVGGVIHPPTHGEGLPMDTVDKAILEAGPVNDTPPRHNVVRSKSSHIANTNNCNSYGNGLHGNNHHGNSHHAPSRSMDNTPSHSPLKIQRSLSPHHAHRPHKSSYQSDIMRERIHGSPDKHVGARSSLPIPLSSHHHHQFSTPQFHRKDIHSLPSGMGDQLLLHHPNIPPVLLPSGHIPAWSLPPMLHGGPVVIPNSVPIIRGRVPQSNVLPHGYPINGTLPPGQPLGHAHIGLHRLPSYPMTPPSMGVVGTQSGHALSCYNCGKPGHTGSSCISLKQNDGRYSSGPIHSAPPSSAPPTS